MLLVLSNLLSNPPLNFYVFCSLLVGLFALRKVTQYLILFGNIQKYCHSSRSSLTGIMIQLQRQNTQQLVMEIILILSFLQVLISGKARLFSKKKYKKSLRKAAITNKK